MAQKTFDTDLMIPLPSYLISEPSRETASLKSYCVSTFAAVINSVSSASICPVHALVQFQMRLCEQLRYQGELTVGQSRTRRDGVQG